MGCFFVAFLLLCGLLGTGWYVALHAIMTHLYYAPLCQQVGGSSRQFVAYQISLPRTMARSGPSSPSRCQFADGTIEIKDAAHPEFRAREEAQWITLGLGFLVIVAGVIGGPALVGSLINRARPVVRRRRRLTPPTPR